MSYVKRWRFECDFGECKNSIVIESDKLTDANETAREYGWTAWKSNHRCHIHKGQTDYHDLNNANKD